MVASTNTLQTFPPKHPNCNVNGQCSATREVKLAIKKTAHKQPKDVNGGVLAAFQRGILFSFSLGAFATQQNLILPGFQTLSQSMPW